MSMSCRKRRRVARKVEEEQLDDPLERLPDDLVICVLSKLCHSSSCPADFINALILSRRFNRLGMNRLVLSVASPKLFSIKANNWSEFPHGFVMQCVNAGSVEACNFLGMIRFYCLGNRGSGASLMAKAAIRAHAPSLYALAIIHFNGSGGTKSRKDLRAGAALCARAAFLGHVDALRELGHCLQDGYGVRPNIPEGRRLLVQANTLELASALPSPTTTTLAPQKKSSGRRLRAVHGQQDTASKCSAKEEMGGGGSGCSLLSDYGCDVPAQEPHPANRFLLEWFHSRGGLLEPGLGMCSNPACGRPEIRAHEFRRCSVCGTVNYCSRGCQAHHWKLGHKSHCRPPHHLLLNADHEGAAVVLLGEHAHLMLELDT